MGGNRTRSINLIFILNPVSKYFDHHYAHLQENNDPVTAFGVYLFVFCMWFVAVVGRYLVGCEHYEAPQPLQTTYKNEI